MPAPTLSLHDRLSVTVPEGESGDVRISRFTVTEQEALRANINCHGRRIRAGHYTALHVNGQLWMSDVPAERRDHMGILHRANEHTAGNARALVTGLGLGMVINALIQLPTVSDIDVIESNQDVINLTGPHYEQLAAAHNTRLTIWHGDATTPTALFPPTAEPRWDFAWHDIWLELNGANWDEYKTMRRRYRRYVQTGEQYFWVEDEVRHAAAEERRRAAQRNWFLTS